MYQSKTICLSENSCCRGPKASRVRIFEDKVILIDKNGKLLSFNLSEWEELKIYLLKYKKLPTNLKKNLKLRRIELLQLIEIFEGKPIIDSGRISIETYR